MKNVKDVYPTVEEAFTQFKSSPEASTIYQELTSKFSKLHKGGRETNEATDTIFNQMVEWLYGHFEINEVDVAAYADSQHVTLCSTIYKDLVGGN